MNNYQQLGLLTGVAAALVSIQPAQAATTEITNIQLTQSGQGIELSLEAQSDQDDLPRILTIKQGNNLIADVLDTQLKLGEGKSFRQENPVAGIASIEVTPLDNQNTRIIISGETGTPNSEILRQESGEIVLSFTPESNPSQEGELSSSPQPEPLKTENSPEFNPNLSLESPNLIAQATNSNTPQPDVLVPNPEILIEGQPAPATGTVEPVAPTPQFLPRAVAPPVGDIAISNIDASLSYLDLGTSVRVPRLVLRDAPVREVLSLLGRAAGINVVYTETGTGGTGQQGKDQPQFSSTISLDLENEPVQDVFNSVLMVSGLEANRRGNTVFVSPKLPLAASNVISRTLRLNQVPAATAAAFLAGQGALAQQLFTPIEEIVDPITQRVVRQVPQPSELVPLERKKPKEASTAPALLAGLSVSTDDRLNSITLVGEPRKVEIATAFLTQLDARRRQVAVNVKVVDVNLNNQEIFGSSFSFTSGDTTVIQDDGSVLVNFGNTAPQTFTQGQNATLFPVITGIGNVVPGTLEVFQDGGTITNPINIFGFSTSQGVSVRPSFGTSDNPLQPGISSFEVDENGAITYEVSPPTLFQYPDDLLVQLQAQVVNGNAKILTDPTLIVQEGQEATVKLVEDVITSITTDIDLESGVRTITPVVEEAGLTLTINVDRIDDNGFVSLSVSPSITAPYDTVPFDTGFDTINFLNLLTRRELSSGLVRLRDNQTLIISGIIQETDRTEVKKVPLLGDIPILGALFRSTDRETDRKEVVIVLTPQILDDSERATWGYNYQPGPDVREMLRQGGVNVPGSPY